MTYNDLDIKKAKEVLENLLYTREGYSPISISELDYSDDINESKPYLDLIDQISGSGASNIAEIIPFDIYDKYDSDKLDHKFEITTVHNDVTHITSFMEKFESFFILSEVSPFSIQYVTTSALSRTKANSISDLPVSEVISEILSLARESKSELDSEKIDIKSLDNVIIKGDALLKEVKSRDNDLVLVSSRMIPPVPGKWNVTSKFNLSGYDGYDPTYPRGEHKGIDIVSGDGILNTQIIALTDGVVVSDPVTNLLDCADGKSKIEKFTHNGKEAWMDINGGIHYNEGYGNHIIVNHNGYITTYAHLKSIPSTLKKGSVVSAGQTLGIMGNTGNSSGTHLHIDIKLESTGRYLNPTELLDPTNAGKIETSGPQLDFADIRIVPKTDKGSDIAVKISKYLEALSVETAALSDRIIEKAAFSAKEVYVNNISGRVEEIEIVWQPGTTVAVPLEGEPAPVMQSLGGRMVKTIIHLKSADPVEISRLALMFKVTNNHDTIASMLTMARSPFYGGNSQRMRRILKYGRGSQIQESMNSLLGKTTVNLPDPVRIDNEVLNSLGLNTFIAESFEVKSIESLAHAYEIMITFSYVNLRNRSLESLKISKYGDNSSILPILTRLIRSKESESLGTEVNAKFYATLARVSVSNCLAELLPLYCISKIYKFFTEINEEIKMYGKDGKVSINMTDTNSVAARMFSTSSSVSLIRETFSMSRMETITQEKYKVAAHIVEEATLLGAIIGGIISLEKKSIFGGVLSGISLLASITTGCVISSNGMKTNLPVNDTGNPFTINIPSIMPVMVYSLISEYINAMLTNTESKFIEDIAKDVITMISDKNILEVPSSSLIHMNLNDSVTMKWTDSKGTKEYRCNSIDMTFLIPGHNKSEKGLLIDATTGLFSTRDDISEAQETMESFLATSSDLPTIYTLVANAAIEINRFAIDALVLNLGSIDRLSGGAYSDVTDFYVSAMDIINKQETVNHCKECMRSIISAARLDLFAWQTISSNLNVGDTNTKDETSAAMFRKAKSNIESSIVEASNIISSNQIPVEIFSGSVADGTFLGSPSIRTATCHSMGIFIGMISSMTMFNGSYANATSGINGNMVHLLPDSCTIESIMRQIDMKTEDEMKRDILIYDVKMILNTYIFDIAEVAIYALSALCSGGTSIAILKGTARLVGVGSLAMWIGSMVMEDATKIAIGQARLFELSKWLNGQIKSGLDRTMLLELCEKSGVWCPGILNHGRDANDRYDSSYHDFPIVFGPLVDGIRVPFPPDFYIHKIGIIEESYQEIKDMMNTMITTTDEMYGAVDGENMDDLLNSLKETLNEGKSQIVTDLKLNIEENINNCKPSGNDTFNMFTREIIKIQDYIYYGFYGEDTEMPVISISCNGKNGKYDPAKSLIHLNIAITKIDTTVNVIVNHNYMNLTRENKKYLAVMDNPSQITEVATMTANSNSNGAVNSIIKTLTYGISNSLIRFLKSYGSIENDTITNITMLPGTIGNMMMIKGLVGSNMRSIGHTGMAFARSQFERLTADSLRRSTAFQAGYHFPTVKLYFIEEDSENFYLFDDLYSYASIVNVKVRMDKYSPQQVATIAVTNLFGNLNNVIADQVNFEGNFTKGPSENSSINAMLLRPGCKIKIQAGFTPLLGEEDTVFCGRITNIDFNTITQIEASGHGDVFLEDMSNDIVKTFGSGIAMTDWTVMKIAYSLFRKAVQLWNETYMSPSKKIRHLIKYLFNELVQTSERLTDFSLVPPVRTMDQELGETNTKIFDIIKKNIYKGVTGEFAENIGSDEPLELYVNQQLFENINITGDITDSLLAAMSYADEGFWISKNETAWDIMSEINLLLPNHIVAVRPYDTRSTVVWSLPDKYYKFKRTVNLDNMLCNNLVNKIVTIKQNDTFKAVQVASLISACLNSTDQDIRSGGIALQSYWAYLSQKIYDGFMSSYGIKYLIKPEYVISSIDTEDMIRKSFSWIYPCMNDGKDLSDNNSASLLGSYIEDIMNVLVKAADEESSDKYKDLSSGLINIKQIRPDNSDITKSNKNFPILFQTHNGKEDNAFAYVPVVVYLISLNQSADLLVDYMYDIATSRSSNHRKLSETHVKVSGRDIVRNEIQLNEPYNVVKISYPKREMDSEEDLARLSIVGGSSDDAVEMIIPLHYKLKPWAYKIYQTYFKNANAFPSARIPAIACASTSILCNLMSNMYSGSITLIGDPSIKEGDRLVIWDENRDMFGVVGVKTHTLIIDPDSGFLSVVEPEMITRNDGKMQNSMWDMSINLIGEVLGIAAFAVSIYFAGKAISYARKKFFIKSYTNRAIAGSKVISAVKGAARSVDNLVSKIPFLGRRMKSTRQTLDWFFNMKNGELSRDLVDSCMHIKANLDEFAVSGKANESIVTGLKNLAGEVPSGATEKVRRMYNNLNTTNADDVWPMLNNASKKMEKMFLHDKTGKAKYYETAVESIHSDIVNKTIGKIDVGQLTTAEKQVYDKLSSDIKTKVNTAMRSILENNKYTPDPEDFDSVYPVFSHTPDFDSFDIMKGSESAYRSRAEADMAIYVDSYFNKLARTKNEAASKILEHVDSNVMPDEMAKILGKEANKGKLGKTTEDMIAAVEEELISSPWFFRYLKKNWKTIGKFGMAGLGINWAYDSVKNFSELYLLTEYTADRVTLAPMWFRGEPLVSGLEGITKKDSEDVGFFGIMGQRLGLMKEGITHSISDPWLNAMYRVKIAALRQRNHTGTRNNGQEQSGQ